MKSSQTLALSVLRLLGVETKGIRKFSLTCEATRPPVLTIERFMFDENGRVIVDESCGEIKSEVETLEPSLP